MTPTVQEVSSASVAKKRGQAEPIRKKPANKLLWPIAFYRTSVGKKWAMAVSGVALMGFVFAHMVGNLKMYFGESDYNSYAHFLREMGYPILPETVLLWGMRIGLIAAFGIHMHAAYSLTMQNRKARKTKYQSQRDYIAASFASRTMRWTGTIVALFILWHLADLTWGVEAVNPDYVKGEVYDNVVASLSRAPVTALYIIANLALGFHLYHGAWSLFQSLGINNPKYNAARRYFAQGFAAVVVIGNISFPVSIALGIVS